MKENNIEEPEPLTPLKSDCKGCAGRDSLIKSLSAEIDRLRKFEPVANEIKRAA